MPANTFPSQQCGTKTNAPPFLGVSVSSQPPTTVTKTRGSFGYAACMVHAKSAKRVEPKLLHVMIMLIHGGSRCSRSKHDADFLGVGHADGYMVMRMLMVLPCMMRNIMIILAIIVLIKMKMMTMKQGVQMCTVAVKSG